MNTWLEWAIKTPHWAWLEQIRREQSQEEQLDMLRLLVIYQPETNYRIL